MGKQRTRAVDVYEDDEYYDDDYYYGEEQEV